MRYPLGHPACVAIEIGPGNVPRKDFKFITIDKNPLVKPDIVRDVEKGLPYSDNTIDLIYVSRVLEYIDDLIFIMNEVFRVLKPKGVFEIIVPKIILPKGDQWQQFMEKHKSTKDVITFFSGEEDSKEKEKLGITCKYRLLTAEDKTNVYLITLSKPPYGL